MNLKKMLFINTIGIFALCFLFHFMYEWFPNPVFSIIFPVNESIWEHMKMLYSTVLVYSIVEYFILKRFDIDNHNFLLTTFLKSIIIIPIYLLMFLPLYNVFGENMFISISVMLISILIVNFIGYLLLQTEELKYQNWISLALIIIVYVLMGYLTYRPPKTELFYDIKNEKYGINIYEKR